jgi:formylglycine-generating enzyme
VAAIGEGAYDADGEGRAHAVSLAAYRIGSVCVTNYDFVRIFDATGHLTEAERFGWSFVFGGLLPDDLPDTAVVAAGVRGRLASPGRTPVGG